MGGYIKRRLIDPFLMPIIFGAVIAAIVISVGETLLALFRPGDTKDRLDRPELWFALGLSVLVIFGLAFIASRPKGTLGPVDREVAVGRRPIFEEPLPQADLAVRQGPRGTVDDIEEGFTLYADNGELALVRGLLPGSVDAGKQFRGFIYAKGLHGASDELWIPIEAVMSVYPESR
ncbi:MAG TPA: hypothetical protein VD789_04400, partial [Thermomicrobiales bacterium]|nr:hypothetical protein [Thermomicrobiales bacterium]